MSNDATKIIGGPAVIFHRGQMIYTQGNISLSTALETFLINVDAFGGPIQTREANSPLTVSFIPDGRFTAAIADLYWRYAGFEWIGQSVLPVTKITAVNAGTNVLTAVKHHLRNAAPVRFGAIGQIVQGITEGDLYYARVATADTLTLHPTEEDATGNTNAVDITALGTGRTRMIEQEPLIIHTLSGEKYTFHVAAVVGMPDLNLAATQSMAGSITFEIFRKNGVAASTDDSRYAAADAAFAGDAAYDPSTIVTQPYVGAWGDDPPFDDFETKNGFRLSFSLGLTPIENDAAGVLTRRISSVAVQVRGQPTNVDEISAFDALKLQGAGAGRGRNITGPNMEIEGTDVFVRVYGAALIDAPLNYSSQQDRAGDFVWSSNRTLTAGVPGPIFYIGATPPA